MASLRRGALRFFGTLSLIVLLLAPLALSGHRHESGASRAPESCALCIATHQSPVATAPPLPAIAAASASSAVATADVRPPDSDIRLPLRSRAPPSSFGSYPA